MRWRIEKEVICGKGQFICGQKRCEVRDGLQSVEVNFRYEEDATKKSTLIKLRTNACDFDNFHSIKK